MVEQTQEYEARQESDPWEDSDWIPANAEVLLPDNALKHLMLETPIAELAIADPPRIAPHATMQEAIFAMRQHNTRALLVLEGDDLIGIVTERDAVLHVEPGETGEAVRVREVMTPSPVIVRPDDPVGQAAQMMCLDGVHHLPVVDDDRVVGLVAQGRVFHAMISELRDE